MNRQCATRLLMLRWKLHLWQQSNQRQITSAACVISSQSRTRSRNHVWAQTDIRKAWSNQNNDGVVVHSLKQCFIFSLSISPETQCFLSVSHETVTAEEHHLGPVSPPLLLFWGSPHLSPPPLRFCQLINRKLKTEAVLSSCDVVGLLLLGCCLSIFRIFPPPLFFLGLPAGSISFNGWRPDKVIPALIILRLGDYSFLDFSLDHLGPPPGSPSSWRRSRNSARTQRLLYCCLRFVELILSD